MTKPRKGIVRDMLRHSVALEAMLYGIVEIKRQTNDLLRNRKDLDIDADQVDALVNALGHYTNIEGRLRAILNKPTDNQPPPTKER